MIDCIFDVQTRALSVVTSPTPSGSCVRAIMAGHSGRRVLSGLRCGISIWADGVLIVAASVPRAGQRITASTQDVIAQFRVPWLPEQLIRIEAWVEEGGERFEASGEFASPRPPQPFPSWVWSDADRTWAAPVEMPGDGQSYGWDEASVAWVVIERSCRECCGNFLAA